MEKQWVRDGGGQKHAGDIRLLLEPAGCSEMSGNASRRAERQSPSQKWERVWRETPPPRPPLQRHEMDLHTTPHSAHSGRPPETVIKNRAGS